MTGGGRMKLVPPTTSPPCDQWEELRAALAEYMVVREAIAASEHRIAVALDRVAGAHSGLLSAAVKVLAPKLI